MCIRNLLYNYDKSERKSKIETYYSFYGSVFKNFIASAFVFSAISISGFMAWQFLVSFIGATVFLVRWRHDFSWPGSTAFRSSALNRPARSRLWSLSVGSGAKPCA